MKRVVADLTLDKQMLQDVDSVGKRERVRCERRSELAWGLQLEYSELAAETRLILLFPTGNATIRPRVLNAGAACP